jgi:hypothetical protein
MTTRDLVYEAMRYNHALAEYEELPERKRRKLSPPVVTPRIQAGLTLIQKRRDRHAALQYAMDMQQLAREHPAPVASIWNDVTDILAEAEG